jgi:hypothetical protein
MGYDDIYNKRRNGRQERKSKNLETRNERWLFVCEGSQTEPNYIKNLIDHYNKINNKKITYKIVGAGKNTVSLIRSVEDFYIYIDDLRSEENLIFGKIFTVFDKDSFKKEQFNNAIFESGKRCYITLWSNECIELWFLLHFDYLDSNISRTEYFKKLSKALGGNYDKTGNIFEKLDNDKNIKFAIENAKKLFAEKECITSFADRSPCTTMFLLINEIEDYFNITIS